MSVDASLRMGSGVQIGDWHSELLASCDRYMQLLTPMEYEPRDICVLCLVTRRRRHTQYSVLSRGDRVASRTHAIHHVQQGLELWV